ncbi:MAG: hypothetical protein AAB472_01560 [Patescibacteria group bacterium]|mgnify:CR=1 FL=1
MKKALIIISVILVLLLVAGLGYYFYTHTKTPQAPDSTNTFPIGDMNQGGSSTMVIPAEDGGSISTLDFIHNNVTFEDPANKGDYYLAGSNDICNPDGTCPKAGTSTHFNILYFSDSGSFVISLNEEPLGQIRREAEEYLIQTLGITQEQMCKLNYTIGTTSYINDTFGGENLGFSFCPGAVKLP